MRAHFYILVIALVLSATLTAASPDGEQVQINKKGKSGGGSGGGILYRIQIDARNSKIGLASPNNC
ncbi:hypothetical protein THASP1DRAFT_33584 [Thamnocephalis sphaerospora]|uniref:Uncharacterized protein n=1 Tax=Thamnocephalis sphaerospora TaxID=78915 RepID=A0A4P9XG80_9FUNG|nr:hypothetical protein THASP1DRAFT_33584 [Thamnocephalis sphaerospora]|eukprot:RKP04626.1 hypothetical protein THASP1DRAFT_33584 [Thamnocephalis sphaerospora]